MTAITENTIYNPLLIMEAYTTENKWIKSLKLTNGAPKHVMLFIIKNKSINGIKLISRKLIKKYMPKANEYYLDRVRATEDVVVDYNLSPVQKLVKLYNDLN